MLLHPLWVAALLAGTGFTSLSAPYFIDITPSFNETCAVIPDRETGFIVDFNEIGVQVTGRAPNKWL